MYEKLGPVSKDVIAQNLERVRARMGDAAAKANRQTDAIRLVAVTKYVGVSEVETLLDLGVFDIGESRIQEAESKKDMLLLRRALDISFWPNDTIEKTVNKDGERKVQIKSGKLCLHLIGHLQTNKADKAAKLFQYVHSIDSERVAAAIQKERAILALPALPVLLEVNVAGEANKYGLPPDVDALLDILKRSTEWTALKVDGLMCMAPAVEGDAEPVSRPVFKKLRELRDELASRSGHALPELSMGMTQDYTVAIEEGATIVRVGSALFAKTIA